MFGSGDESAHGEMSLCSAGCHPIDFNKTTWRTDFVMDDQNWLKYAAVGLIAVGFVAIVGVALTRGGDLEGHNWIAEELTLDGVAVAPIEGTVLTASFDGDSVAGSAGCNSYNASYETDGDALAIGPAASTLKFCQHPSGTMDQEIAYLALLQSANRFVVSDVVLTLFEGDTALITYVQATSE